MAEERIEGFDITAFSKNLGNVSAANQFYASITLPQTLQALFAESDRFIRKIGFSIKATSVPDMTVTEISVPFRNAKFRIPGDRDQSGTWEMTIRSDVDSVVRNVFERWNDSLIGTVMHDTVDDLNVLNLMGVGEIHQLGKTSKILKSWTISNCWPTTVGAIAYDWSSENTLVEFPTTFAYQSMESTTTRNNLVSERDALSGTVLF